MGARLRPTPSELAAPMGNRRPAGVVDLSEQCEPSATPPWLPDPTLAPRVPPLKRFGRLMDGARKTAQDRPDAHGHSRVGSPHHLDHHRDDINRLAPHTLHRRQHPPVCDRGSSSQRCTRRRCVIRRRRCIRCISGLLCLHFQLN